LSKKSKGLGLKNLEERLKIEYNNRASFTLRAITKDQVEAKILIPMIPHENI